MYNALIYAVILSGANVCGANISAVEGSLNVLSNGALRRFLDSAKIRIANFYSARNDIIIFRWGGVHA